MLPPDTQVGKYKIRAELGRGAMGIVYVAHDSVLDRDVALKLMAGAIVADSDLEQRFRKEARAVAKLQSPHIVTVHDFGYHETAPYIAMELLSGMDLEARMRSSPPNLSKKIDIVIQICQGLAHAHQQGIVHRDIKPANIFLPDGGLVKIMDFGTARLVQSTQTQTGTVMGTVAYMSPEQIQGLKVDGRSDIFSLGVLFYRLLCHQQPFGGENVHHIIYKILNVQQAGLVLPQGAAMPGLQRIVDKALAKDLNERYQTAEIMAAELSEFLRESSGSLAEDTVFGTLSGAAPGIPPPGGSAGTIPIAPTVPALGTLPVEGAGQPQLATQPASTSVRPGSVGADRASGSEALEGETIKTERLPAGVNPYRQPDAPKERFGRGLWMAVGLAVAIVAAGAGYYFSSRDTQSDPDTLPPPVVAESSVPAFTEGTEPGSSGDNSSETEEDALSPSSTSPSGETTTEPGPGMAPPPPAPEPQPTRSPENRPAAPPPPRVAAAPPPPAPDPVDSSRQVRAKADEVRIALTSGQLLRAQQLIDEGRRLAPEDPTWDRLDQSRLVADFNQKGDFLLGQGVDFITSGQIPEAISSFDEAEQSFQQAKLLDPSSRAALEGIVAANRMRKDAEADRETVQVARRQFQQSQTRFEPPEANAPTGFQSGSVQVAQATTQATSPAEVVIEVVPEDAKAGEPYSLRIRLRNVSNQAIFAQSLEVVSTFKGRKIGQGQPKDLNRRRVDAQGSVILFERNDRWSEELDQGGEIEATVILADRKGTLTKTLQWSAP